MTIIVLLIVGVVIGLLTPWLFTRFRRVNGLSLRSDMRPIAGHGNLASKASLRKAAQFSAVEIQPCLEACDAAWQQKGQRYLSTEAPALPLAGCNAKRCACRFGKYVDRRTGEDRRFNLGAFGQIRPQDKEERRGNSIRRQR